MKKWVSIALLSLTSTSILAQAPSGYYDSADSLVGEDLRIALRQIIRNHTVRTYANLWTGYGSADRLPDGTIWDMYSHNPNGPQPYSYTFRTNQCGNYNSEADCYNREHTWPQSRFGDGEPMESDIVLVIPTDGYVNSKRSNWAYGEVSSPTWTSMNGSKVGTNRYPGSPSTTAFEPIDEYKGDIARIMFYVVTRYYKLDNGWQVWDMGDKAELKPWAKAMFLEWHRADPVSAKERDRNNAIYDFQDNRNPYVDYPEYVDCVFDPSNCSWQGSVDTGSVDTGNSIQKLLTNKDIKVFPNPTQDVVTVDLKLVKRNQSLDISLFDLTGRNIYRRSIENQEHVFTIDLSDLPKGMFVLKISNEEMFFVDKIVKK